MYKRNNKVLHDDFDRMHEGDELVHDSFKQTGKKMDECFDRRDKVFDWKSRGIRKIKKLRRKYFVPNPPRCSGIITITSSVIRRLQFLLLAMVVGETGFEYWVYNYWGKKRRIDWQSSGCWWFGKYRFLSVYSRRRYMYVGVIIRYHAVS